MDRPDGNADHAHRSRPRPAAMRVKHNSQPLRDLPVPQPMTSLINAAADRHRPRPHRNHSAGVRDSAATVGGPG